MEICWPCRGDSWSEASWVRLIHVTLEQPGGKGNRGCQLSNQLSLQSRLFLSKGAVHSVLKSILEQQSGVHMNNETDFIPYVPLI